MKYLDERKEIIGQGLFMLSSGLSRGTAGNLSVRVPEGYLITPSGIPYEELNPEQIVLMSMNGEYEGTTKPSSEWQFHQNVLSNRADINAVVHTHSTYATAVAVMEKSIPPLHYTIAGAGVSRIPCAPYATFGSTELADHVTEAMRVSRACLLAHHGVITAHINLRKAMLLATYIEELARLYVLCLSTGKEPPLLTEQQMAEAFEQYKTYGVQPAAVKQAS